MKIQKNFRLDVALLDRATQLTGLNQTETIELALSTFMQNKDAATKAFFDIYEQVCTQISKLEIERDYDAITKEATDVNQLNEEKKELLAFYYEMFTKIRKLQLFNEPDFEE